jgi:hypothetical protein
MSHSRINSPSQDTTILKLIAFEARSRVPKNACYVCPVGLFACIRQIFVKCNPREPYKKSVEKQGLWLKSDQTVGALLVSH